MTQALSDRDAALMERAGYPAARYDCRHGWTLDHFELAEIIAAARLEALQEVVDQAPLQMVVPDLSAADLEALRNLPHQPIVLMYEPVVQPWTRTAAAQVRDLQEANNRYQQEARDARAKLAAVEAECDTLVERLLTVDPNAPGRK